MSVYTERFRPRVRAEIVGNKDVIDKIFALVQSGNFPHLCLEGIPGVGKTTVAYVIARTIFGEYFSTNFLELNASDERRIDDVRTTMKTFAKTVPFNASFKILLLDEADNLTADSQQALRRIMEKYSDITKFIFSVNHLEKLIDPIQSRCQVFRFGPISIPEMDGRLSEIYAKEKNLTIADTVPGDALRKIAELSHGDMRRALNHLQLLLSQDKSLTVELVESVRTLDYGQIINESLKAGRFVEAKQSLTKALELGYSERNLIEMFHKLFIVDSSLSIECKAKLVPILCESDCKIVQGASQVLVMDDLMFKIIETYKNQNLRCV